MEIFCPNCKQNADLHTVDEVEFINCPECGWFEVQGDHTMIPCDEPTSKVDRQPEPGQIQEPAAAPKPEPANGPASTSEGKPDQQSETPSSLEAPSDKPGLDDEDDEDQIKVVVKFED